MTTPAPNLRGRYHSALYQTRGLGQSHSSSATPVILEVRVAEGQGVARKARVAGLPSQSPAPEEMWPFADRVDASEVDALAAVEETPKVDHQDARRKSIPEVEQQEELTTSLRPSKSLSSLKLVPVRHGLCIPPGAVLSKSSEVCAKGEVYSPPRRLEAYDQQPPKQPSQKAGQIRDPEHQSISASGREDGSIDNEDTGAASSDPCTGLISMDDSQKAGAKAKPTQAETSWATLPAHERNKVLASTPVLESDELRKPVSILAADNGQSPAPGTVLDGGNEALAEDIPRHEPIRPNSAHPWLTGGASSVESPVLPDLPQHSSPTLSIPTIRVQQTTESGETVPQSGPLSSNHAETSPRAVQEKIWGASADQPEISALTLTSGSAQLDTEPPDKAKPVALSAASPPEMPGAESEALVTQSANSVEAKSETDHPGFTKLAVRKARNLVASQFVLSILLGRQLAEQTKPQLQVLARPSAMRPGKIVSESGPSQIDGIAELNENWSYRK